MMLHKYLFPSLTALAVLAVIIGSVGMAVTTSDSTSDSAQVETQQMPTPQKEHEWLARFAGEWTSKAECEIPGLAPMECEGTQTARMIGGFWMIAEGSAEMMGTPVHSVLTLGYNPDKKHYVGTWIDSCNDHIWHYKGTLDDSGNVLTLDTEGPDMMNPDSTAKYREVIEFKSDDHYTFTSSMQGEDGQWQSFMTANFRRVK